MKQLGLFAKFWEPGKVKTRLGASVGPRLACDIYEVFLFHLLDRLDSLSDRRLLAFSPADRAEAFRRAVDSCWELVPQSEGDLGHRMETLMVDCLSQYPGSRIVLIGADSPQVDGALIESAFEQLIDRDVVIGPSTDGGYYLIGCRDRCPSRLFREMPWSTDQVLPTTLQRLQSSRLSYSLLDPMTDVDDAASLHQLIREVRNQSNADPLLALKLEQIDSLLGGPERGATSA